MTDEQRQLLREWKTLVNMTERQLERFLDSPLGKRAGLSRSEAKSEGVRSGRDSARAIIRMKGKPSASWTSSDWAWAKRQVAFIRRMKGNTGPLMKDGKPTRKLGSLLLWGHKPSAVNLSSVLSAEAYARNPDYLSGGRADECGPEDFEPASLREGTRHEMEHTDDERIAREIAMDHLAEDPDYYAKLAEMEAGALDYAGAMERRHLRNPPQYTRLPNWPFAVVRADGQLDTRSSGRSEAVEIAYEQSMKTGIPHLVLRAEPEPARVGHAEWVVWNFDGPESVPAESALPPVTDPSYFLTWAERGEGETGHTVPLPRSMRRNAGAYYVWLLKKGSTEPMVDEGPYGPFELKAAKTYARISATEGVHDRVVTRGRDPQSSSFEVVRRYKAGSGARMTANAKEVLYRGWRITHEPEATQLGYRIRGARGISRPGKGRKISVWEVHYPDEPGGTKTVSSLKAAKRYIDEYLGD